MRFCLTFGSVSRFACYITCAKHHSNALRWVHPQHDSRYAKKNIIYLFKKLFFLNSRFSKNKYFNFVQYYFNENPTFVVFYGFSTNLYYNENSRSFKKSRRKYIIALPWADSQSYSNDSRFMTYLIRVQKIFNPR